MRVIDDMSGRLRPDSSGVRKLDSLKAWVVGRTLAVAAYRLTLDPPLRRQFALADQIRRSAGSIPANIAEGYALGTTAQFVRFLRIALGSTAELRVHLDLVQELEFARGEALSRRAGPSSRSTRTSPTSPIAPTTAARNTTPCKPASKNEPRVV